MQHLGPKNFPRTTSGLAELERVYFDLPHRDYQAKEREVFQIGVQEINQQLSAKRLLLLVDTLEAWDFEGGEGRLEREIYTYASQFSNALFFAAGRNVRQRMPDYASDFGPDRVTLVEVDNFDRLESAEFFDAADPEGFIPAELRDKLHFLTTGRPVLLSLAVEWLRRQVPLPEMVDRSLEELKGLPEPEWRELCARFEFELVERVRALRTPLDHAVLYMAHISRRCNARILSALLGLPVSKTPALQEQLVELSFVRHNPTTGNFTLHDEMRNLINRHVWPIVDLTGDLRRRLARQVIRGYYEPRISELGQQARTQLESDKGPIQRATIGGTEWEHWRLEAECLHYHLLVSEQEGVAYFNDRFSEARRSHHLTRMQFLLNEMELARQPGIQDALQLHQADTLRLRGEVERAAEICERMLAQQDLSPDNRTRAYIILGLIATSTDLEQARQHYESALRIAEAESNSEMIGVVNNNLGQLYRLASRLDEAIQHYRRAIDVSRRAGHRPLLASATNNLAYVHRLLGDLRQADVLCRVAMSQRKQMGLERDLAYSYLTKGEIDRDRGDLESAERFTKLALRSFDKLREIRGQIRGFGSLANIRRHMGQYEEAEAYLERGVALANQLGDEPLMAELLNVYGREQRDRALYLQETGDFVDAEEIKAHFRRSEQYLERSLQLAQEYGDAWLVTRSQFELALAYFYSGSRSDEQLILLLDEIWDVAACLDYGLLHGYLRENRGEIAQRQGDFATAARYYGLAAQLISQGRGREPERFFDRLSNRLLDPSLAAEAARDLARGILDVIGASPADASLQTLHMLCQQVLDMHAT
jgi:tetratricopeptide (TPR) repeat protein